MKGCSPFLSPQRKPQLVEAKGFKPDTGPDCYSSRQLRFRKKQTHKTQNLQKTPYTLCRARVELHCSHSGEERELLTPLQFLQFLPGFKEESYTEMTLNPLPVSMMSIAGTWIS